MPRINLFLVCFSMFYPLKFLFLYLNQLTNQALINNKICIDKHKIVFKFRSFIAEILIFCSHPESLDFKLAHNGGFGVFNVQDQLQRVSRFKQRR